MSIRIFGDSHVGALLRAWRAGTAEYDLALARIGAAHHIHKAPAFYEEREGKVYVTKARIAEGLGAMIGRDYMQAGDALYGLIMGTPLARIIRGTSWQSFAPWRIAAECGLQPLSSGLLESYFANELQYVLGFFDALHRCGVRFFVLAGPPPRRNHPAMKRGTSPKVVLEVARMYGEYFRRQLSLRGYPLIEPPAGMTDHDGFLKAEFESRAKGDHSHANTAYGKLYLAKVFAEAGSMAR
jgi:hypothetical protein